LRRNIELTEENNQMLRSIKRMTFWGGVLKYFWWVLILFIVPGLAYYLYLAPYVDEALNAYKQLQSGVSQVQGIQADLKADGPLTDLKKLYEQYQASQGQ
jgi:hypothetical protein